ncbi:unnamed protein product [Rotaria sp. Silwood2]|nr:unnamed protein product [Rotaria sp. Silwood2]
MTIDFKVVAYNIFEGGADTSNPTGNRHPSTRLNDIAAFLRSLNPTLTVLTELNGFDSLRFSNFASQWNHQYTAFLTAFTGFHLGISSSFPLIELAQVKHGMHHGALVAQVNFDDETKIGLVATHLNPFTATARTIEAKIITDQIKKQDVQDWIIAGDLNSLSERDAVYYEPATKFSGTSKLKAKFLTPDSNSIDYTTLNHFIQQGYIDTLSESDQFTTSVPTKPRKRELIFIKESYLSCARYVFDCKHVVLIGGGIGITQYASILSSLMA